MYPGGDDAILDLLFLTFTCSMERIVEITSMAPLFHL
jgi:hypothetical protein